jgi:hypothetical protein
MKGVAVFGVLLIVLGIIVLAKPMISYTKTEKVVDLGPIEVTQQTKKGFPISPIAGGAAVIGGIALLFAGRRSR